MYEWIWFVIEHKVWLKMENIYFLKIITLKDIAIHHPGILPVAAGKFIPLLLSLSEVVLGFLVMSFPVLPWQAWCSKSINKHFPFMISLTLGKSQKLDVCARLSRSSGWVHNLLHSPVHSAEIIPSSTSQGLGFAF